MASSRLTCLAPAPPSQITNRNSTITSSLVGRTHSHDTTTHPRSTADQNFLGSRRDQAPAEGRLIVRWTGMPGCQVEVVGWAPPDRPGPRGPAPSFSTLVTLKSFSTFTVTWEPPALAM